MDITTALSQEHGKLQTELVATYIGENKKRFETLMTIAMDTAEANSAQASQAARVMRECADQHPHLIPPYRKAIVEKLRKGKFNTPVKRQCTGILQSLSCPPDLLGPLFDCCYRLLGDPNEAIAVRVNAMTTVVNICKWEPELADETSLLIKQHLPFASPAFQSRAQRELAKLEKIARSGS